MCGFGNHEGNGRPLVISGMAVRLEEAVNPTSSLSDLSKNRDSLEYYVSSSPGTIVELRSARYSFLDSCVTGLSPTGS